MFILEKEQMKNLIEDLDRSCKFRLLDLSKNLMSEYYSNWKLILYQAFIRSTISIFSCIYFTRWGKLEV